MSDREATSTVNLGLASSLVSRFDLVLILSDERNNHWDTRVANHIFYDSGPVQNANLYDLTKLQAHFAAVRDFDPVVTDAASRILKAYYLACRADEDRDAGRTTLRFCESLYRLAKSHAKLLFRNEVTEVDAALVVMLMESSFGFGRILQPQNVLRGDLPLGPSDDRISELMDKLNLEEISPDHSYSNAQEHVPRLSQVTSYSGEISENFQIEMEETENITDNNSRMENVISTARPAFEDNVGMAPTNKSRDENVRAFDAKKYAFQKRHIYRASTVTVDENSSTTATVPPHDSSSSYSQHRNQVVVQPLLQLQNNLVDQSTSNRKRIRLDYDVAELDELFTLDDPIPESTKENVNVPVGGEPSASNVQRTEEEQPKRSRIFNNYNDEDLAAFDDLDF